VRIIVAATLLCVVVPRPSWGCATCNCGDSTLTTTGVEQPYKNRVRLSVEEWYGDHRSGSGDALEHTYTLRSSLAAIWSPIDRLTFGAFLPWVTTWLRHESTTDTINGLGDLALSARVLVARDRKFAAHHLFWLNAGLKTPTGPRLRDDSAYPYSDDDQPGSGSWDPFGGATYAWFSGAMWSAYASVSYRYTTSGPRGYRRGSGLGWTASTQLQPWTRVALSLGFDGSWIQPDELQNGHAAPNTGGVLVALAPGVLVAPRTDVVLRLIIDVPVVQELYGQQQVGVQTTLTLNWDVR
jgi:hypothetical protein